MQQQDIMSSKSNMSMSVKDTNELVELHKLIQDIVKKTISNCTNIPRVYTMVCCGVESYMIKAVFPQDIESSTVDSNGNREVIANASKIMTFPNYSNHVPIIGQGLLVMTTGGSGLTGGFVIAVMGAG